VALTEADLRRQALEIFHAALRRVEGRRTVRSALQAHPVPAGERHIVAIGKAAASMAMGAEEALGSDFADGLLVTKQGYEPKDLHEPQKWRACIGEHPVPGPGSLAAGEALIGCLESLPPEAFVLFLVSGGASSLVEVLPPGMDLNALRKINDWLLASGLDIEAVNRIRQRFSRIKGGRLRAWLGHRPARVLEISDVAGDDIRIIGSGLLAEPLPGDLPPLPAWLREWVERAPPFIPKALPVPHEIVARLDDALLAAAETAKARGFVAHLPVQRLFGDTTVTAREIGRFMKTAQPGAWIWGGETTLRLPPNPGRGGRNQHFALTAAIELAGCRSVVLLAAGSDGTDGPTADAGALVDGGTVARGEAGGMSAAEALAKADSGAFLALSGDLVTTGPTGTNVMDLVIAIKSAD